MAVVLIWVVLLVVAVKVVELALLLLVVAVKVVELALLLVSDVAVAVVAVVVEGARQLEVITRPPLPT
jgi:hypothetical protein